jgi:uncharacterized damage-inducible protein DinB
MTVTNLIACHIKEVYEGNNWTDINIADTINDLNWQQAQQQINASPNTIASLLHHLFYWNGIIIQRLNGFDPSIPEVNGYDVTELKSQTDWNELKDKTHESFIKLAEAVKDFPEENLEKTYAKDKPSYYKNFQGIVEHAHYHLGQIVILKKLIKPA